MVCLGLEPRAAGWKAQMNPLIYGGTPNASSFRNPNQYTNGIPRGRFSVSIALSDLNYLSTLGWIYLT